MRLGHRRDHHLAVGDVERQRQHGVAVLLDERVEAAYVASRRGDLVAALSGEANSQVVIGFSAGAFIAKSNGVATPTPPTEVKIGSISNNGSGVNLGSPVVGTAPNLTPSSSFFADSTFGRRIYNVFPTSVITGFGNADLKDLFVGSTSKICQATGTINTFGFLVAPDCGVTTITGDLLTGQL